MTSPNPQEGGKEQGFLPESPSADAGPSPRSPEAPHPLEAVRRSIRFKLDNDLKHRTTGRDPKSNGYAYAEVPDWALRQWLSRIELVIGGIEIYGSAEIDVCEGYGTEQPQADQRLLDEPENPTPQATGGENGR